MKVVRDLPELHVTGMSWTTPLGDTLDGVWQRLTSGHDGFRAWDSAFTLRNELVADVPEFEPELSPGQRQLELTARTLRAAFADASLAVDEPGVALVMGTSYGAHLDDEEVGSLHEWARRSADLIGFPGDPVCVTTACSASADSLLVGAALIRSGACRVAVCGGADIVTAAKRLGHSGLGTMTDDRLRAFDEHHSGMLLGEGSGFLVLEAGLDRVPRSYAVLRGVGSANDAAGMTAPEPTGHSVALAVRRALSDSGLDISDIAAVSAHGTGTTLNDEAEALGLTRVFAGQEGPLPAVFGTKGALGHSLGACGAIEAISLIMALRSGLVPPVHGLRRPIAAAEPFVELGTRHIEGGSGLSLTLGFGGFNTALAFSV